MIGIRGNFSLILRTIFAVSAPPLTFNISAPASILLCISVNSDTIVTERWIEKIVECAYSKPEIMLHVPTDYSNLNSFCLNLRV